MQMHVKGLWQIYETQVSIIRFVDRAHTLENLKTFEISACYRKYR